MSLKLSLGMRSAGNVKTWGNGVFGGIWGGNKRGLKGDFSLSKAPFGAIPTPGNAAGNGKSCGCVCSDGSLLGSFR